MDCQKTIEYLDDYFDGHLDLDRQKELEEHVQNCQECTSCFREERVFRQALREMPAPEPTQEFRTIAFRNVAALHLKKSRNKTWYSIAGAVAAGLLLWLSTTLTGISVQLPGNHADITLAVNETQDIKVLFDSPEMLLHATLTIVIPKGLDLVDYPDTRELSWVTNIKQGQNMLTLPIRAIEAGDIVLVTRVEHDNHSSTQSFNLAVHTAPLVEGRLELLQTV